MTHEELESYQERYNEIMKAPKRIRDLRLVNLMEDMQQCYNIPTLRSFEFEKANLEVMELYRQVSISRSLEEVN